MKPLPFKWVFKRKPLDTKGRDVLYKARCVVRGDRKQEYIDFDPSHVYAPVASYEAVRFIIALAANHDLILGGGDISNFYLCGTLDAPILMQQPTDSSGEQRYPGFVCEQRKSIYGLKQAGEIWGSLLATTLTTWGFITSNFDKRVFFIQYNPSLLS